MGRSAQLQASVSGRDLASRTHGQHPHSLTLRALHASRCCRIRRTISRFPPTARFGPFSALGAYCFKYMQGLLGIPSRAAGSLLTSFLRQLFDFPTTTTIMKPVVEVARKKASDPLPHRRSPLSRSPSSCALFRDSGSNQSHTLQLCRLNSTVEARFVELPSFGPFLALRRLCPTGSFLTTLKGSCR